MIKIKPFWKTYASLAPLLLLCTYYVFKSFSFEIHDFANYYFGSYFLKEGDFSHLIYFPHYFNAKIAGLGFDGIFVSYAPNTPFLPLLLIPFSFLPIVTSKIVFNILSVLLFLFSFKRLSDYLKIKSIYVIILPFLFFIPIKNNILFGQLYLILFFLLSEGYLAYKNGKFKSTSIFWSLAIFVKVFPLVLFIFLFIEKKYKALVYLALACITLLIVSLSIGTYSMWEFYITSVLTKANNGEFTFAFVDNYQSLFMFLKRLLVFDQIENPHPLLNSTFLFKCLIIFIKIFVLGIAIYLTKYSKKTFLNFSLWILASILISPYNSSYITILLMPLYLALIQLEISNRIKAIFIVLFFCIANISYLKLELFPLNYLKLFSLSILTAIIIFIHKKCIRFKPIIASGISVTLFALIWKKSPSKYKPFLNYKTPILMYDYKVSKNNLTYTFWNENGETTSQVDLHENKIDSLNLSIPIISK